ncbi:tryptophan synthase beta subunit-like PLP-dependent enzyme [Chytriomyces sp. MP71]|nr:tryptophan synthase beta subunit-like PLP-dependent enzyme [Chytriomyces sp. MP71]
MAPYKVEMRSSTTLTVSASLMSAQIHPDILSLVGETPVVKINRLAPEGVHMYVKLESQNPMASVKDRLALAVIEDAERRGLLKPGQTVVEATSGNTG